MELDITDAGFLSTMLDRKVYEKHGANVKDYMCTKLSRQILQDFGKYYDEHPTEQQIAETQFRIWYRVSAYPALKNEEHGLFAAVFDNVFSQNVDTEQVLRAFNEASDRETLARLSKELKEKKIDWKDIEDFLTKRKSEMSQEEKKDDVFDTDIFDIITTINTQGGLEWRLEDLNRSVGPIRQGDFILLGKRPETGGTSFLCSEFTYLLSQLPEGKDAIIFNNEEAPEKVLSRLIHTALGISEKDLLSDPKRYSEEYSKFLGTKRLLLYSSSNMTTDYIEERLNWGNFGLIGLNVLGKIQPPARKGKTYEDHDMLEALGGWCRSIANQYAPVLSIVQADITAEGVRYPDQHQIYKSKTALQGEADALIMIGRDSDPALDDKRFFHIAKNKLPGSTKTLSSLRHGKFEVAFDIETGRFTSINFKGK